ncbi:MAG: hopanoid biosynthesis-associated RND transporter HpnN, partial [Rhodospirillaceae bacterium]|nr:hopanoid biosynthesis-associated RND transporter HpnN [Rhodospirillaceae bacterium]
MLEALRGSYRQWLVRWVDGAHRRALAVVSAALLMTVLALAFVAQSMSINTDTSDMLSPELEFRRLSGELSDAFPQFSDNLLVVIDGDTPDLADDAAMRLAVRLRQNPDVFGNVYDPGGDAFFRKNGLLFLDVDELADLGDRLAEAQPFLGVLWRNPGMVGLFDMLSLMIDENDKADGVALPIGKALESVAEIVEAQNAGKFAQLSWRNLMDADDDTGNAGGPYRRFIELQPRLDFSSLQP